MFKIIFILSVFFIFFSCFRKKDEEINIDGSSTVFPLSEAVAEEYLKDNPKARISISVSGTGGGFKRLCSGNVNIIGASRTIKKIENDLCLKNNIKYLEIPIAYDGIVLVVNKNNKILSSIDVDTLRKIFDIKAEKNITSWHDIDDRWPDRKFKLVSPGISSGTYDYFVQAILGPHGKTRGDMITSEDDNILVYAIKSNNNSLGFLSFAYFQENRDFLKALALGKEDPIYPSPNTIKDGKYSPLSRLIYLYVNKNALLPKQKEFLRFYLHEKERLAPLVGFITLDEQKKHDAIRSIGE